MSLSALKIVGLGTLIAAAVVFVVVALGGRTDSPQPSHPTTKPDQGNAAVRTATRFLVGMDTRTLLDDRSRRRFVSRWASRRSAPELQRLYAAEAKRAAPLSESYSRAALLGYRVDGMRARAADVTIWAVTLASVRDLPTAVGWRTLTVALALEDGRWRITNVREVPGPTPRSRPASLRSEARRFDAYRLAP